MEPQTRLSDRVRDLLPRYRKVRHQAQGVRHWPVGFLSEHVAPVEAKLADA